jgi:hypothetical protein
VIEIKPATLRDASFVTANLGDMDRAEALCQLPDGIRTHELAWSLLEGSEAYAAFDRDRPVAIFGTAPISVCALSVWMLGTKRMWRAAPAIARYFETTIVPGRIAEGYRTMEARSIDSNVAAHRWMKATGATVWTQPFEWGKNGERFILLQWNAADFLRGQSDQ